MPSRSRWLVGSSMSSSSGCRASSRAIASRLRQPPGERRHALLRVLEPGPRQRHRGARSPSRSPPRRRPGQAGQDHCLRRASCRRRSGPAARSRPTRPRRAVTIPASGVSAPARMRSSVVLPDPFGPTSPTRSPAEIDERQPGEQRPWRRTPSPTSWQLSSSSATQPPSVAAGRPAGARAQRSKPPGSRPAPTC